MKPKNNKDGHNITPNKAVPQAIKVTNENALPLAVKYLELIFARLGYMIKLYEQQKMDK